MAYRFRWAACQLDALEEYEMPHDLLQALDRLPATLEETYQRILDRIPQIHLSNSTRILQFVTYAKRPLMIREAIDILATTLELNPKFDPRNRMPDPRGVLKFCSSLVTISEDEGETKLALAHSSVKEYLVSSKKKDPFESELDESRAHEAITKVLVGYMSSLTNPQAWYSQQGLMLHQFPLAIYGARYWIEHAKQSEKESETRQAIISFSEHQEAWSICIIIYNPETCGSLEQYRDPQEVADKFPLLYVASRDGLPHVIEDLLLQDRDFIGATGDSHYRNALRIACQNNDEDTFRALLKRYTDVQLACRYERELNDSTPLLLAIEKGYSDLVELLLECGVNPNAKGWWYSWGTYSYPLVVASAHGSEELRQMLLNKGALPDEMCGVEYSSPQQAYRQDHDNVARLPSEHGADINLHSFEDFGETPSYVHCVPFPVDPFPRSRPCSIELVRLGKILPSHKSSGLVE